MRTQRTTALLAALLLSINAASAVTTTTFKSSGMQVSALLTSQDACISFFGVLIVSEFGYRAAGNPANNTTTTTTTLLLVNGQNSCNATTFSSFAQVDGPSVSFTPDATQKSANVVGTVLLDTTFCDAIGNNCLQPVKEQASFNLTFTGKDALYFREFGTRNTVDQLHMVKTTLNFDSNSSLTPPTLTGTFSGVIGGLTVGFSNLVFPGLSINKSFTMTIDRGATP